MKRQSKEIAFFSVLFLALFLGATFQQGFCQDVASPIPGVEHVVLIGVDGMGGCYTHWDELPNLKMMKENGAWTLHMRCVLPSVSAINWASILMGAPSEMHGYRTWGSKEPDLPSQFLTEKGKFPCIFSLVRAQLPEAKSVATYDWDGIGYVFETQDASDVQFCQETDKTLACFKEQLKQKPTLAFVYFGEPDSVGHSKEWGSADYQASLVNIDRCVGEIIDALKENEMADNTIVLFISDHGGTGTGHGEGIMEHMEVPWIVYGPGVKKGEITDVVVNYDNAATMAWILGLQQPQAWRGIPIFSAFEVQ